MATLAVGASVALLPQVATARPNYQAQFHTNYTIKPESKIGTAKCGLCHGAQKTERNAYGKALEKIFDGKTKLADADALAAIKKAENEVSGDKKTKFIELIKADKLPGEAK
jgi:hypothetical protein